MPVVFDLLVVSMREQSRTVRQNKIKQKKCQQTAMNCAKNWQLMNYTKNHLCKIAVR